MLRWDPHWVFLHQDIVSSNLNKSSPLVRCYWKVCLQDVVHVFMQSIIDLTLSLGSRSRWAQGPSYLPLLQSKQCNEQWCLLTLLSSTDATQITVMPCLQNCPKTLDQSRDWYHLGFIDLGSVIGSILISIHFQYLAGSRHLFFLSYLSNCCCRVQF